MRNKKTEERSFEFGDDIFVQYEWKYSITSNDVYTEDYRPIFVSFGDEYKEIEAIDKPMLQLIYDKIEENIQSIDKIQMIQDEKDERDEYLYDRWKESRHENI